METFKNRERQSQLGLQTQARCEQGREGVVNSTVYTKRNYLVGSVSQAQEIASGVVGTWGLPERTGFGLPEVDDRYHVWRVPLLYLDERVGEIVIDARSAVVDSRRSTTRATIIARLQHAQTGDASVDGLERMDRIRRRVTVPEMRNTILSGPSQETLQCLPAESVQLMFTSPPYFNARPDYADYRAYADYLFSLRAVIHEVHRVLEEGRFAVINCSPVLVRRARRSEASKRIAVPFDIHQIFVEEGFEFIDDIIWVKPAGAGWATGRGRRFAADRNPLQYKAVPVTEYVLVYRKQSDRLIDWHIRNHPNRSAVERSKIADGYDVTNVWHISPAHCKTHPAIFPLALAEKVIRYYSFENDVALDPYAGVGTVGGAAIKLNRRFVLSEINPDYIDQIRKNAYSWLGKEASQVHCVNCAPIYADCALL